MQPSGNNGIYRIIHYALLEGQVHCSRLSMADLHLALGVPSCTMKMKHLDMLGFYLHIYGFTDIDTGVGLALMAPAQGL